MMRRVVKSFLAFLVVGLLVLIGFVRYAVNERVGGVVSGGSRDLEALGKRLDSGQEVSVSLEVEGASEVLVEEGVDSGEDEGEVTGELPTRLARSLSSDELAKLHGNIDSKYGLEVWLRSSVMKIEDTVSRAFGKESLNGIHTSSALGYDMMELGDWESARRYLWEAVDVYETSDPTQCKFTLGVLAWLEDDLEKAVELLELSCQGEFRLPYPPYEEADGIAASQLANAYRLCRETGSTALAAHYLGRLREEYPK